MGEPRSWEEFMEALTELVGQAADTGGSQTEGTLAAKENAILEVLKNGGMPVVKSVQRGIASISGKKNIAEIQLKEVNPDKCIVIVDTVSHSNGSYVSNTYFSRLEATKLTIGSRFSGDYLSASVGWQVVEFF